MSLELKEPPVSLRPSSPGEEERAARSPDRRGSEHRQSRRGIPTREVTFLLDQLSLILETGSPLVPSLRQIAAQASHQRTREVTRSLVEELEGGNTFARALAQHPEVFSPVEVSMMQVGEAGGFLAEMVKRLLELRQRRDTLRSALRGAVAYPLVLMVVALGVMIFMLGFIFPRFSQVFANIETSLPVTTRLLMGTSEALRGYWYLILGGAGLVTFAVRRWSHTPQGRRQLERAALALPVVGNLMKQMYLSQLFLNLGSLLKVKVSLMSALTVCRGALGHHAFRGLLDDLMASAERGEGLGEPFSRSPLVPGLARGIIATGEETGRSDVVFLRLAAFYDQQVQRRVKTLTSLLEPALLILMGGVVGFIVISLVLPIFRLSRGLH